jgi:hypothetical protein
MISFVHEPRGGPTTLAALPVLAPISADASCVSRAATGRGGQEVNHDRTIEGRAGDSRIEAGVGVLAVCLVVGAFAAFFGFGFAWSQLRTVYPAFLLVTKRDDFDAIHRHEERRIFELVPIALANIIATPALWWLVPSDQRIWVALALAGLLVSFGWGTAVQIPAHLRLNKEGQNSEKIARLARNEWVRFIAVLLEAAAYVVLLFKNL